MRPRPDYARIRELEFELGLMDEQEAERYRYEQAQAAVRWRSPRTDTPGEVVYLRAADVPKWLHRFA